MEDPALLLICYDRPEYLSRTLNSLAGLDGLSKFHLYISQVCYAHMSAPNIIAAVSRGIMMTRPGSLM